MELGNSYMALTVKDIKASKEFYERIGFEPIPGAGSFEDKWFVLRNGKIHIGIYEGMFPKNTITFNPKNAREIFNSIKDSVDIKYASDNIGEPSGKCSFLVMDPDGNPLLFDQFSD